MLRAYNAEADNAVRSLAGRKRTDCREASGGFSPAIANLGKMMEMHISDAFHALRIEEIELTADYLMKKQEEREAAREERREATRGAQGRAQELAAERERLDKERSHLATALGRLQAIGSTDPELEPDLQRSTERSRKRLQGCQHSGGLRLCDFESGAFGDQVVKIGLTRRLEPLDRINELGGRSSSVSLRRARPVLL